MTRVDPLQNALAAYASEHWNDSDWRTLGRETGTTDILNAHSRLYRSLTFGDDDYPDAALSVLGEVLSEAVGDESGEAERMELFADSMPDLPQWIASSAPPRTKRLFKDYLEARDASEIPAAWRGDDPDGDPVDSARDVPEWARKTPPLTFPDQTDSEIGFVTGTIDADVTRSLFIVHGHDEAALNSIRIFVHKLTGIMPVSLAEEAGRGQTIIEKFETIGDDASFVIVLLTPDDVGQTLSSHQSGIKPDPRARQNVVLELGYFIGKIGRENIVVVVDAGVERPSDLAGLSYVQYPGSNWKDALRTELQAASVGSTGP